MSDEPVVAIDNLYFAYNGATVLEDVSLTIGELDFVGIVGPNGGGKTTLLRLMLGLLEPTAGTVRVFGEPPVKASQRIGYVPQSFQYDPRFPVTVSDVVLMGRLGSTGSVGPYRRVDWQSADGALRRVGLDGLGGRPFGSLSSGQRQRALIARALASQTEVLMLDEPTASVDAGAEQDVYALLEDLNQAMTIILVTHDLGFVSKSVETVLCVNRNVMLHPTSDINDITADMFRPAYGSEMRVVRHDESFGGGGHR